MMEWLAESHLIVKILVGATAGVIFAHVVIYGGLYLFCKLKRLINDVK